MKANPPSKAPERSSVEEEEEVKIHGYIFSAALPVLKEIRRY